MVLVTGATGHAGSAVVRALLERGHEVRAFVRDPAKAQRLFGDAVEPVIGDLAEPAAVRAALAGAEAVVLSGPDDPRRVEWETRLIDAAPAAGVRRIVKLSTIGAEPGAPVAFWDWHGRVEAYLRWSGVPAVVLRSYPYMSNVLAGAEAVAHEGRLFAPAGDARIAMIDVRDVGAAAAAVVSTGDHDGHIYVLSGPAAITYAQVASVLSDVTGRDIAYVDVPDDAARAAMVGQGLPELAAEQIVGIFAMLRQGVAEPVTSTVEALTGRPPSDFTTFARDHAALFAPAAAGVAR